MTWAPDILGEDYEFVQRQQPADYSGCVVSTIIRRSEVKSDRAVLYIHGFSDYFLQHEVGREINRMGYGFYALDLRKYGRSHLPTQKFLKSGI